jgi:hypothetical protein
MTPQQVHIRQAARCLMIAADWTDDAAAAIRNAVPEGAARHPDLTMADSLSNIAGGIRGVMGILVARLPSRLVGIAGLTTDPPPAAHDVPLPDHPPRPGGLPPLNPFNPEV